MARQGYKVTLIVPHQGDERENHVHVRALPKPGSRLERMSCTVIRILCVAVAENAGIYHFHDPELIPVGMLLKLLGKRVVYDVHEDLPRQILNKYWIPAWLRGFIANAAEMVENACAYVFDGIVAATPAIAGRFPANKTATVQNFPVIGEMASGKDRPYAGRAHMIAYVGSIGEIRGIRKMVQAMALLPQGRDARLLLAGSFRPSRLEAEVKQLPGWSRVSFLGWQPRHEVRNLLAQSRVGLVLFHPTPNHTQAQPNKLFEYMSAAIPVIASDFPLWREIVNESGCGMVVDPLDIHAVAEAIEWLLAHPREAEAMGRRGQEAVRKKYNWNAEAIKLLEMYKRLLT